MNQINRQDKVLNEYKKGKSSGLSIK